VLWYVRNEIFLYVLVTDMLLIKHLHMNYGRGHR